MKRKLSLFIFVVVSHFSFSQNAVIEGQILDAVEDVPLANVTVNILETDILVSSDTEGKFIIKEDSLPIGNQELVLSKSGYVEYKFPVYIVQGKKMNISDPLELLITSEERKKRNEQRKQQGEIGIPKKWYKKKLKQNPSPSYSYDELTKESVEGYVEVEEIPIAAPPVKKYTPLQWKYAEILEVEPKEINNKKLYKFIDKWMGTPYLMGGNNQKGIDCSSFTLSLFAEVYGKFNIGRTAEQQLIEARSRNRAFKNPEYLQEGDLIFFGKPNTILIDHVGVYLGNGRFVNSTSRKGPSGKSGVKISDLKDPFWMRRIIAYGRW